MFADVIIDIQHEKLDKIFQYRVPESMVDELEPGMEVVVPFGRGNRRIKGYVTGLAETCDYDLSKVKEILEISRTGVEIEALTGVSAALLTIYDMCKAMDRSMELGEIHLVHKEGGKSGVYDRG